MGQTEHVMCSLSVFNSDAMHPIFRKKNAVQSCYSQHGVQNQKVLIKNFNNTNNEYHRIWFKSSLNFAFGWNDDQHCCDLFAADMWGGAR